MADFTFHTITTAPEASKPLLEASLKAYGRIPGLHAVMAESPELFEGYQLLHELFQKSSLSVIERNVVWLTINVEHTCHYCVPAHTVIAQMQGVDDETIHALRDNTPLQDPRLEALRKFTLTMVRERGRVNDPAISAFLAAGFTKRNVLDIILGIAQKTMSNYTNHLANTPVDPMFTKHTWTPPLARIET
jgi:AhpD family alkylhydroperoxidase